MQNRFMMVSLVILLGGAATPLSSVSNQNDNSLSPSFPCIKSDTSFVSRTVCSDQDLIKAELETAQAYFAFKQSLNGQLNDDLKSLSNDRNNAMNKECPKELDPKACIKDYYINFRSMLIEKMDGPAREEAIRPFNQQMDLQRKLKEQGFLPEDTKIDGVYGIKVRDAIKMWQKANGREETGLLGDDDATLLFAQ